MGAVADEVADYVTDSVRVIRHGRCPRCRLSMHVEALIFWCGGCRLTFYRDQEAAA
jgi:hypothetical protein